MFANVVHYSLITAYFPFINFIYNSFIYEIVKHLSFFCQMPIYPKSSK